MIMMWIVLSTTTKTLPKQASNYCFTGNSPERYLSSQLRWAFKFGSLTYIFFWFSGDHDLVVPHIYTEYWIGLLDITLDEDWRPWFVGGQVAG